ncbi:MAG: biotin/lipoyl-binding protein, partial [Desulfomonilaceae bacterium]|nr:biotin/lipoyl-binding protein [Desulfomonilaceae bacterium]
METDRDLMPIQKIGENTSTLPHATKEVPPASVVDPRQRFLASGLEFCKRVFEAGNLEDLYLLLTNDVRNLVEFDRSSLVVHLGGASRFVAAGLQPAVEKKSKFYDQMTRLAQGLRGVEKGLFLSGEMETSALKEEELPAPAREAVQSYLKASGCTSLFCVPLTHDGKPVGHLILEFFETQPPGQTGILTLLNISSFLGSALAEKWLMDARPSLRVLMNPDAVRGERSLKIRRYGIGAALALSVLALIFLMIPFPFDVGGETEIVPTTRYVAFCGIEGLIQNVFVHEGSQVEVGQVLATLDPKDLDHKVKTA